MATGFPRCLGPIAWGVIGAVMGHATIISASSSAPADTSLVIANTGFGVPAVTFTLDFPALDPISILVNVDAGGAYLLHAATLNIRNDSGATWTTFDVHTSSTPPGSFISSLGYNSGTFPSLTYFPAGNATDAFLQGASIASRSSTVLQVGVIAPSAGTFAVEFIPNASSPAVPEPASASVVAIGLLLGCCLRAARQRRPQREDVPS